ncbi:MAG: DNA-3-methyladenine glycosylase [Actinomycetota bacterium]|nr:DNA-3-methyladenine glycosylase [Actinomycetota bacterium]MDQ2957359.1 DNA-3-methyladenine glycosylase [Actinomycetota bacterium]
MLLDREFLSAPALAVAPTLLGARVLSLVGGQRVVARITEVEAYEGGADPASHAYRGRTKRNGVMFGEAGHLYCYFVYGMHWCANVVCGEVGTPTAVLLRAAEIVEGEPAAFARTPTPVKARVLASGPARLARSLGLNGAHTGLDLLDPRSEVQLLDLAPVPEVVSGPRVGVAVGAEHPWRFWLPGEPTVSAYRPGGRKRVRATGQTE